MTECDELNKFLDAQTAIDSIALAESKGGWN
jgi:hypothetical protein